MHWYEDSYRARRILSAIKWIPKMSEDTIYFPCDIGFSHGQSFISRMIRKCTTSHKESKSVINHVFAFISYGDKKEAEVVESLWKVTKHKFLNAYAKLKGKEKVVVFRPVNLTDEQKDIIIKDLLSDVGADYPWWQFPLFFTDWLLFDEKVVTRKWINHAKHKVCSTKTARAYVQAGLFFGVPEYAATPDDMYDFCIKNPDKYQLILPLSFLDGESS